MAAVNKLWLRKWAPLAQRTAKIQRWATHGGGTTSLPVILRKAFKGTINLSVNTTVLPLLCRAVGPSGQRIVQKALVFQTKCTTCQTSQPSWLSESTIRWVTLQTWCPRCLRLSKSLSPRWRSMNIWCHHAWPFSTRYKSWENCCWELWIAAMTSSDHKSDASSWFYKNRTHLKKKAHKSAENTNTINK